jgi:hypothetical protein
LPKEKSYKYQGLLLSAIRTEDILELEYYKNWNPGLEVNPGIVTRRQPTWNKVLFFHSTGRSLKKENETHLQVEMLCLT